MLLANLAQGRPFSLFLEWNILLYTGILAFIAGLGWTISTWSRQLGDIVAIAILSALVVASVRYCFRRAAPWSPEKVLAQSAAVDYVLYAGCLIWLVELAWIEQRFHLLSGQWDNYLLATAALFFVFAYRFDNRFVLSLALSSLAGWFGIAFWHGPAPLKGSREGAILYSLLIVGVGTILSRRGLKAHFVETYLNIAANVLFAAVLSGLFTRGNDFAWLVFLLALCAASLAWGLTRRQFIFVAYAAVYGYIGVSAPVTRILDNFILVLGYFVVTGAVMLAVLVQIARHFGRES
ncbi:MAG TPA: hypothetical protein VKX25_05480 [Bryobacteraceae bacterium]|nr:hypothetical protein [Bryobacteraceae bacterium]